MRINVNAQVDKMMEKVPESIKKDEAKKQAEKAAKPEKNAMGLTPRQMTAVSIGSGVGFLAGMGYAFYRYNKGTGGGWGFLGWSLLGNIVGAAAGSTVAYALGDKK